MVGGDWILFVNGRSLIIALALGPGGVRWRFGYIRLTRHMADIPGGENAPRCLLWGKGMVSEEGARHVEEVGVAGVVTWSRCR